MCNEIWKGVAGYEEFYSVSNLGRVRRDKGGKGSVANRILTPKGLGRKYLHVDLSKDDHKERFLIHRLVAFAFLGKPPYQDAHVNHKNFDGHDNRPENLEWVTPQENVDHAIRHGRCGGKPMPGESNGRAILTDEDVVAILRLKGLVGQRDIAKKFNVSRTLVQRIHQRLLWSHIDPSEWPEDLRVRQFPTPEVSR